MPAPKKPLSSILLCILLIWAAPLDARAVILYATGDPAVNTTAPTGELADSGWQYQGQFGGFLGTPIAPQFFITAKHIGHAGTVFTFNGVNYTLGRQYADPQSDLAIWQVSGAFPFVAPLYTRGDEVGQRLVVIGRGTERGGEIYRDGTLRGWGWGAGTAVQRWGENLVSGAFTNSNPSDPLLAAAFDANGLPNEAHLSSGDSGGAVFLQDGPLWKLAGINYAVDALWSEPADASGFNAAIFDARGYYRRTGPGNFVLITSANPVPTSFYATRISAKLDWIYSVIDPTGDRDQNGLPNLLEYAFRLDPEVNSGAADLEGTPQFTLESGSASLVYRKVTTATDIQYNVQQSADLITWSPANAQEQRIALSGNVETVKATVPLDGAEQLFLRVTVTRP